jgi:hypothetical protein
MNYKNYLEKMFEKKDELIDIEKLNKEIDNPKKDDGKDLFDYLDTEEEKKDRKKNKKLYDVFNSCDEVMKQPEFEGIQSVDPRIDVNNKRVVFHVITKEGDKQADRGLLELFVKKIKEQNKDIKNLKYKDEIHVEDWGSMENASNGKVFLSLEITGV